MKRLLPVIVIMLILFFAGATHAFTLSFPEKTVNVPTVGARDVIITLRSDTAETVAVNLIDSKTWTSLNENLVRVVPGETEDVVLTVSPFQDTTTGLYKVTLIAESLATKQNILKDIFINVYKGEVVDIEKIVVSGDTRPTGDVSITVFVKNYKSVPANEVVINVVVSSPSRKIFEFTEIIDNINPDQKVSRTRQFTLERGADTGTYRTVATLLTRNETKEVTQTFTVAAKPVIITTEETTPLMFGFSKKITIRNDGNAEADTVTITNAISGVESVFYSGNLPTRIEDGTYIWLVRGVTPGEVLTIGYKVDYTSLFMFILAIIILGWILFFKLRTVRIKKYIIQKKELEEGEEFTVGIEVKNASGRKKDEITVRDFIPPVFEFKHAQTPEPTRKKTAAGTELTWKLKDVHHREERLVSYKIVPLFGVHGTIRLPRASATFKQNKREMTNHSTYAVIGISTEDAEESKRKTK
ncbi:MAG: hypothetical protein HY514_00920 [Candidatus Aenigmarchaeota archaeon]|nr:hypothetical protein [Candidatus Aenigmarchaeota archaeon]